MQSQDGFTMMTSQEFPGWLACQKVARPVKRIQWHHTWAPDYAGFNGKNHFARQKAMKDYHMKHNGWGDIAQQFTIFPDGAIVTGRPLSAVPIGIKGGNTGGICIENFGNFDIGGDVMRAEQKEALLTVTALLLRRFSLTPESGVTYHGWWSAAGICLGDYVPGKSIKTCPGTNFMGVGNTKSAYLHSIAPLLREKMK